MNIPVLRKVDKLVGIPVLRALSIAGGGRELPKNPKHILLIKLFGFGNFIFLSPLMSKLKAMYPAAKIDVLTFSQNREICGMYPGLIDNIHTLQYSVTNMPLDSAKFIFSNRNKYDLIIDLEQFVRFSAILGKALNPNALIGIPTYESGKEFIYDKFAEYKEDKHIVNEYADLAGVLGKSGNMTIKSLPRPSFRATKAVKKKMQAASPYFCIGVCMGGRSDDAERRYPKDKFVRLLSILLEDKSVRIAFVGSRSESTDVAEVIGKLKQPLQCLDMTGISLNDSAYCISQTSIFISNDTGPIHLAASLGVFCIGLYGPSKPQVYGPYTEKKMILRDDRHQPVRSNHNEKDVGWSAEWWPKPETAAKLIKARIKAMKKNAYN